jgi:antitoxin HicB
LTDASRYPANVFWSNEDEGFIAVASDLPGCSAFGETQHEALTELQSAIAAWIEAARAAGNPIPEPSQPAADNIYSGKILVRMPKSLHAQLAQAAKTEAVSLNQHIVFLLTWATTHRTLTNDWTSTGQGLTPGTILSAGTGAFVSGGAVLAVSGLSSAPHGARLMGHVISTEYFGTAGTAYLMPGTIPQKATALGRRTS